MTSGREKSSAGTAADYAEALQTLNQAIAAADRKVAMLVAETIEKIELLGQQSATPERASNAQKLVMGTNSAVLKKLPATAQIRLMNLMRGNLKRQPPATKQWEPFLDAQAKLYQAMGLRPELLAHEKELRRNVMNELRKDKIMLQEVRDLWHTYTLSEKRHIMMKIARVHSKVLGCEPPLDIQFDANPALHGCLWQPDRRVIVVGTASGKQMDFEQVMNSLFHENTHNWQDQLARNLTGEDSADHPLHEQAMIFKGNKPFYASSSSGYSAYRFQPVEVHAYRSGRRLAADLMRMLAS